MCPDCRQPNCGTSPDGKHNRRRLSTCSNLKDHRSDVILCADQTRPCLTVENILQVRAVFTGDRWGLHLGCNVEIPVEDHRAIIQREPISGFATTSPLPTATVTRNCIRETCANRTRTIFLRGPTDRRPAPGRCAVPLALARNCRGERTSSCTRSPSTSWNGASITRSVHHGWRRASYSRGGERRATELLLVGKSSTTGSSTASPRCSNTMPRNTASSSTACPSEIPRRRVRVGDVRVTQIGGTWVHLRYLWSGDERGRNRGSKQSQNDNSESLNRAASNGRLARPGVFLFDRESGRVTPNEQADCKPQDPNIPESSSLRGCQRAQYSSTSRMVDHPIRGLETIRRVPR